MKSVNGELTLFTNPRAKSELGYSTDMQAISSLSKSKDAINEISQWPGYGETPLYLLENLAADIGVDKIYYKDESQRFHLKSFKALGGAYAVARQLQKFSRVIS